MKGKERVCGLDIIRALAVFFVISVHFFLYTPFYEKEMYGTVLYGQTIMRWLFYTCVPLFLILTGYLKCNKELNKKHYKSIIHILTAYLFASICVILFRKFYLYEDIPMIDLILGIFSFTTDSYAWYIEMYIGLFLLIPFLNILYKNLGDRKKKQIFIFTLLFLTSITQMGNGVTVNDHSLAIFPNYWNALYPFTYYFIGAYIKEYQITMPKLKNIMFIFLLLVVQATISYALSYGNTFSWQVFGGYGNIFTTLIATLIFILFYQLDIKNKGIKFLIKDISLLSLDIYLLSYVVDHTIYPYLTPLVTNYTYYVPLYFVIVPLILLCAYLLANLRRLLFKIFSILYVKYSEYRHENI